MSIQAIDPATGRAFNPNRDPAHNFAQLVADVIGHIQKGEWFDSDADIRPPPTGEELGAAVEAFTLFVAGAADDPHEPMAAVLARSGWWGCPPGARLAVAAAVGRHAAGVYFRGVREAMIASPAPLATVPDLVAAGAQAGRLLRTPRWRRGLARYWGKLRKAARAYHAP